MAPASGFATTVSATASGDCQLGNESRTPPDACGSCSRHALSGSPLLLSGTVWCPAIGS